MEETERKLTDVEPAKDVSSTPGQSSVPPASTISNVPNENSKLISRENEIIQVPGGEVCRSVGESDTTDGEFNEVEPLRVLCQPERRQATLTTVLPLTGRLNIHQTNRETIQNSPVSETTDLSHTPNVSISTGRPSRKNPAPVPITDSIIIQYNDRYLKSCPGIFRLLQVSLSMICLISLTTSGSGKYESYLLLPLSWHFRVMVFVLVLTILTSLALLTIYTTGLYSTFPLNWPLLDLILYGTFTFLYLVGTSLVASAFDFYQKMGTDVPDQTIRRLILSVVLGYMAMFLYLATAIHGYKKWKWLELHQFRRQKLIDTDEIA